MHWASKETYHFFRATFTKIHYIKINNIWTQISFRILLDKNIWKTQDFSLVEKERTRLNHERSFFENRRNCSPSELHGGSLFKTFNSYSFNFNGGLRKCRTGFCLLRTPSLRGKQFPWFLKIDLLRFHRIYLLYDWSKLLFFSMCLLRINLPNLCANMIHVDALDFSGWHSKEVISFFWRSVYFLNY